MEDWGCSEIYLSGRILASELDRSMRDRAKMKIPLDIYQLFFSIT
jgi:hypothetical protein